MGISYSSCRKLIRFCRPNAPGAHLVPLSRQFMLQPCWLSHTFQFFPVFSPRVASPCRPPGYSLLPGTPHPPLAFQNHSLLLTETCPDATLTPENISSPKLYQGLPRVRNDSVVVWLICRSYQAFGPFTQQLFIDHLPYCRH